MMARTAAEMLWAELRAQGAEIVFGLPGSQTIEAFQPLKHSGLRTVVPTHEMAAAFMANGYARATGRPGIVTTIPGPGFTYALTGLAEAWLDSVPLLHVVPAARSIEGREFALQAIDQPAMAGPVVKRLLRAGSPGAIAAAAVEGYRLAAGGEPGPVMVEALEEDFGREVGIATPIGAAPAATALPDVLVAEIATAISRAPRVLLYLGAGALDAAREVRALADAADAAIATTTSGRGVVSEDDPRVVVRDPGMQEIDALSNLVARADLVVAIGCKFSHNGAAGFRLELPRGKLVTINAAGPSLNYPAKWHATADSGDAIARILPRLEPRAPGDGWKPEELATLRESALRFEADARIEPRHESTGEPSSALVHGLREALPDDAIVVTDSGYHQMSVRRHYTVRTPRGLMVPTNFQSMGYALPAAIGAALGAPSRRVVAVVGDGGMLMSGLELSTAVRERVPLTVVVFNDGAYRLIRNPQLAAYGESHGTDIAGPDLEALAAATGAKYRLAGADGIEAAIVRGGREESQVLLVEVPLVDSAGTKSLRRRGRFRVAARRLLPARGRSLLRRLLGR
jgi:acetolactate synthase I/II/III large subunit